MKILTVQSLTELLKRHGFDAFMIDLIAALRRDFLRWESFTKMPRPTMHVPGGVLELMPVCDNERYYTFKYVNCHPKNPSIGLQTVVATGQLSRIDTGYPLLFSEMTILTALRTAAAAALATDLMARKDAKTVVIIGTGAQAEFQIRALQLVRDITKVRYFDLDLKAMEKFERNMKKRSIRLVRCKSTEEAVQTADIITLCTAARAQVVVLRNNWIAKGVHINAIGGDSPGKTELEQTVLPRCRIIVEYLEQSLIEGEIQHLSKQMVKKLVHAELHELINGTKKGRENDREITLFDSVGIALEDYSVLRLTYELAKKYDIGEELDVIPVLKNSKDLFSVIKS